MTQERPSLLKRIGAPEPAPPWSVLAALLAVVVAFVLVIAAYTFTATLLGLSPTSQLIAWAFAGLLMVVYVLQSRRKERDWLKLDAPRAALPLMLVLNIGFAMLLDLLSLAITGQFLPVPELIPLAAVPTDVAAWIFAAIFIVIAQPIGEELIFRAVTQPALRSLFGAWQGLIMTALIYGLFHRLSYEPSYADVSQETALWYGLVLPILQGLVFGMNRAATNSTRAAIWAHVAFGLFALLKVFVMVR